MSPKLSLKIKKANINPIWGITKPGIHELNKNFLQGTDRVVVNQEVLGKGIYIKCKGDDKGN